MRRAVCLALALAGCASATPVDVSDSVACELVDVPRSPHPDAAGVRPALIGGLEGLRRRLAGLPEEPSRRGAIVGEVILGNRSEPDSTTLTVNTSALPDSLVRRVLATTEWQPGDARFPLTRTRCRIRLRLGRTDEGERLDQIPS